MLQFLSWNKAKQALLVSAIVATSLFSKVNDAVASTLKANDKQDFQTEQITEITDNTASSISMNLDNTPPDSTEIKNFFIKGDILDAKEIKDFNQIWNNAAKSGIRDFYQQQIEKLFN
jgi:azurin